MNVSYLLKVSGIFQGKRCRCTDTGIEGVYRIDAWHEAFEVKCPQNTSLAAPEIGECRYIHQTLYAPDCLTVDWSDVEGAVSYEMEMCYSDCEVIATYSTESSRYSISANRGDKNVTGCCRGHKIRVRAIDQDGNPGKWSEYSTVGCNSLRG